MRIRATVAYDGAAFHGWARQPALRTVQGELEDAFSTAARACVVLTVAGRTDAGVHAVGQVISGDVPDAVDLARIEAGVNAMTGPDVVMRHTMAARPDFSARFDAVSRTYVYRLQASRWADPLSRHHVWATGRGLDVGAMREAALHLHGAHDFAAFCRAGSAGGTVREVVGIRIDDLGSDRIDVWMTAASFCHQMVRSVVGLLVTVGAGRRRPIVAAEVLESRDRSANTAVAPPPGLTLWSVAYPGDTGDQVQLPRVAR